MKNIFDLTGKTAIVTGGAGLLGRTFVYALASFGAKTFVADIDKIHGVEVVKKNIVNGLDVQFVPLDISDESSVVSCIKEIKEITGSLDVWINNAYPRTDDWWLEFEKIPIESWRKNIDMHLNGYCLCCQKVAEEMKAKNKGSIINISSIYGSCGPDFTVYEGTDMTMPAAYAAIKGAIVNFTRYLASYYGKNGVRINTISPGGIFCNQPKAFVENYNKKVPLKRMGNPEDIAGAIVYLASDASRYVTGQNLFVDGGWSAI